ncbi:MAG: hypothetical protein LQ339_003571 [Xanthoria mediterranea]|nr:MAG: hypothetical protein LQ339_003571 [Xanthoria mediterranea]
MDRLPFFLDMRLALFRPSVLLRTTFPRVPYPFHPHRRYYNTKDVRQNLQRISSVFRGTLLYPLIFISWFPIIWFFHTHVFQFMWVTGRSMYPFLNTDMNERSSRDVLAVSMWNPTEGLRRGDVVIFRSPTHPNVVAVKRVIALEGDTVLTRDPYPVPQQEISLGHVWVEGEHPEHTRWSYDSNTYGAVSKSLIIGRAKGVVWPWSRRSSINADGWRGSSRVIQRGPEDGLHIIP